MQFVGLITLALVLLSLAAAALTLEGLVVGVVLVLLLADDEPNEAFLALGEIGVGLLAASVLSPLATLAMFNTMLFLESGP